MSHRLRQEKKGAGVWKTENFGNNMQVGNRIAVG